MYEKDLAIPSCGWSATTSYSSPTTPSYLRLHQHREDIRNRHFAVPDVDAAILRGEVCQVLDMKVVNTIPNAIKFLKNIRSGAHRMADVHAQPHSGVHVLDALHHITGSWVEPVFRSMIVDCHLAVVLDRQFLDLAEIGLRGGAHHDWHASRHGVFEIGLKLGRVVASQ